MARAQALALRPAIQKIFTPASHAVLELLIAKWRLQRIEVSRLSLQLLGDELLGCSAAERAQALQTLCTELVDYVSTGHFEIYGRVLPRKLRSDPDLHALLQHIFHSIGRSTDAVLDFNDRFQYPSAATPIRPFRQLLLRLNRALQLRFALEEQLLDLCGHSPPVVGLGRSFVLQ